MIVSASGRANQFCTYSSSKGSLPNVWSNKSSSPVALNPKPGVLYTCLRNPPPAVTAVHSCLRHCRQEGVCEGVRLTTACRQEGVCEGRAIDDSMRDARDQRIKKRGRCACVIRNQAHVQVMGRRYGNAASHRCDDGNKTLHEAMTVRN